ncbi:MAG TPA: zf-HC2 domain-containing protein [Longimicrobiaceae bacterium]|nr:zf-HC2 domain-containing protein [Longimicrobiaceae bacterium]
MSNSFGHVPQWTLELYAEGALPPGEREEVGAHVEHCAYCTAELEASRALFASLAQLPRFAPEPDFSDAVMARVTIRPEGSAALARVRRWLPATRKGWMGLFSVLLAPFVPLLAVAAWLLSYPLVTVSGLATMGQRWASEAGGALADGAVGLVAGMGIGIVGWGRGLAEAMWANPTSEVSLVAMFMAAATPVAAFTLVRLLRTPMGGVSHAN